jgi:signal recognition particle receptor subunit beta
MAALNPVTREVVFKIVFYGPGLGGKTTSLQYVHAATRAEHKGKMVSLATPTDRTLYFDYLPLRVPRVRGLGVRLQLFTVPGQTHFEATRKLVLSGVDGIVFVADSQRGRVSENRESLEDLRANLAEHNRRLEEVPHTFQWNKRDLSDLVSVSELEDLFNPEGAPSIETIATRGDGVFEGLERITGLTLAAYEAELPRSERGLLNFGAEGGEAGIAEAIRGLVEASAKKPSIPPPAPLPPSSDTPASVSGTPPSISGTPATAAVPQVEIPAAAWRDDEVATRVGGEAPGAPGPPGAWKPEVKTASGLGGKHFSFAPLWPEPERDSVRQTEALLASEDATNAILACELIVTRVLASAAMLAGTHEAPRDPGLVTTLLGLDGTRYLAFRSAVRAARQRQDVTLRAAFECYAFALEARRARDAIQ